MENEQCPLLSGPVCEQLRLMTINHEYLINIVNGELIEKINEVLTKYKDVDVTASLCIILKATLQQRQQYVEIFARY